VNGTLTGLMGILARGETDALMGPVNYASERLKRADFPEALLKTR